MSLRSKWLRTIKQWLRGAPTQKSNAVAPKPTPEEWLFAREQLEKAVAPSVFGELGGFRPKSTEDRHSSWWGGNFLGSQNESTPTCNASGRKMLPIFQVRTDELPFVPKFLEGVALLNLWFDPETEHIWEAQSGTGFVIRTYDSLDDLKPLGLGYRQHKTLPTFPIRWHQLAQDLPDWEDFVNKVPSAVARQKHSEWFFGHPAFEARAALQKTMPIKLGGYAQWWQSPQKVDGGKFGFFLDSTARGSFGFPAGGNANFFFGSNGWEMRVDCT